eukprot:356486-Chlamydomonas_euryale.AAC.1
MPHAQQTWEADEGCPPPHRAQIVLETGEIGRQANGAIMASCGETVRERGGSKVLHTHRGFGALALGPVTGYEAETRVSREVGVGRHLRLGLSPGTRRRRAFRV